MRLARFNIQTTAQPDKRYFVGMPSPPAAGVVAATVYAWPVVPSGPWLGVAAVLLMFVPAALMMSTVRYRSFKTVNFGVGSRYRLVPIAALIYLIYSFPGPSLVVLAYGYLVSPFVEMAITRWRSKQSVPPAT
jgi:CDP-diacylglycerol--serine O-phosphatidyltransferase